MSTNITIGKYDGGAGPGATKLNRERLLATRMLVTSDSGGGKSYLLRKILEAVSKTTQTIVIDPEGEFASLREIRDMALVGPDGEVPVVPRYAGRVCRWLMERNVSAVIDLSEIDLRQRQEYVANFASTMIELPKSLWHPCIVAVDEAHESAPEDDKTISAGPLALLSVKGRKRGYCLLCATTRLSNLSKNVAGGLKNQFLGTFSLDTDIKRAAAALGFGKDRWPEIRDLSSERGKEGEFFCVGPAFNRKGVQKMRADPVESTHPKVGQGKRPKPPAPSKKILGVLDELKELPQEAEQEIKDLAAAKSKITELERELRRRPKEQPQTKIESSRRDRQIIARLRAGLEETMKIAERVKNQKAPRVVIGDETIRAAVTTCIKTITKAAEDAMAKDRRDWETTKREVDRSLARARQLLEGTPAPNGDGADDLVRAAGRDRGDADETSGRVARSPATDSSPSVEQISGPVHEGLNGPQQRILDAIAWFESIDIKQPSQGAVAGLAGYAVTDSAYKTPRATLKNGNLVNYLPDNRIALTGDGRRLANKPEAPLTLKELHAHVLSRLSGPEKRILQPLLDAGGKVMSNEDLATATGYSSPDESAYKTPRASLRKYAFIDYVEGGVCASSFLFPDTL